MNPRQSYLDGIRRVVLKVGSQVLTNSSGLDPAILEGLCAQIVHLQDRGIEVILVTSGAVATGRLKLGMKDRPKTIPLKQASAAVGQAALMGRYSEIFARHGRPVAQLLLTADDLRNRRRFLNARNTLQTLFELKVLPIINENDTVAVDELKFGDNDRLSALVTNLAEAQLLIILTDVDGFYDADPRRVPTARRHDFIDSLTPEHLGQATATRSNLGLGGMITKLEASRQAALSGASTVLVQGTQPQIVQRVLAGEDVGTFIAASPGIGRRKHWIAYTLKPAGTIAVDSGAVAALTDRNTSLLPSGVTRIEGDFGIGECVLVVDPAGQELARGLVGYSSEELRKIQGHKTAEIEGILGYKYLDEVIHRSNLVLTALHRPRTKEPAATPPTEPLEGASTDVL